MLLFAQEKQGEGFGIYSQFPPDGAWIWILLALACVVAVYLVFVRGKKSDDGSPPMS